MNVEIANVEAAVEEFFSQQSNYITGYKLAKLTNEVLDNFEMKNIPAQMIYNYLSKKLIASVVIDDQRVVSNEVASKWVAKYITKKLSK